MTNHDHHLLYLDNIQSLRDDAVSECLVSPIIKSKAHESMCDDVDESRVGLPHLNWFVHEETNN